ncbi:uncharacterized protein LOC115477066 [Microcaecilia unicolor]|uniref:Uncharacterized protein LOC115477066 n=1 Tax=Microcaecilia unicolor TaxID=1415580 RepID=A0A6P7YYC3_9AMPH|nr:uncharacterized protein LOC115477066 [Microcaecilia unicolor]
MLSFDETEHERHEEKQLHWAVNAVENSTGGKVSAGGNWGPQPAMAKTLKNDKKRLQHLTEENLRWMSCSWKENRKKELEEVLRELEEEGKATRIVAEEIADVIEEKKDYIERDCWAIKNYMTEREILMKNKRCLQKDTEGLQENIALLEMEVRTGFLRPPVPATDSVMYEIIKAEWDEEMRKEAQRERQEEQQSQRHKFLNFILTRLLRCLGNITLTFVSYMVLWLAVDSCKFQDQSFWAVFFEDFIPLHASGLKPI